MNADGEPHDSASRDILGTRDILGYLGDGHLGDVYDFMRFYSINLIDFSLSMISPFLDKRLTAD